MRQQRARVAIVDYGMGNLSSVRFACEAAGLDAVATSAAADLLAADGVILPGVGAFGSAMENLRALDLVAPLHDLAASSKPLVGICLGMQLLMTESYEFGHHRGLGIVEGAVVRLDDRIEAAPAPKIPHVGWNQIHSSPCLSASVVNPRGWSGSPLAGLANGTFMYFVHSYQVVPARPEVGLSVTRHGAVEFCSALRQGNVVAFQFHPERSGRDGLRVYRNLAMWLRGLTVGLEETDARTDTAVAG